MASMIKCVICEAPIKDYGHNPDPISQTGRELVIHVIH